MESQQSVFERNVETARVFLQQLQGNIAPLIANEPTTHTMDTMLYCDRTRPDHLTRRSSYKYELLENGLAILFTTEAFLESRSHRITVPADGEEVRYHRDSFNVDCQSIGSRALNLLGLEEICANDNAHTEYRYAMVHTILHVDDEQWPSMERSRIRSARC